MLTPDITKSDISWEEMGILSQMLNIPECDYVTPEQLARYSTDPPSSVRKLLDALVKKDFVRNMDGIYCINKYRIKDMQLTEIQKGQVIRFTDDVDGKEE
jgi:hypothetical protein